MARDLPSAVQTALQTSALRPVVFFEALFPSGAVRLNSSKVNLSIDGNTYTGISSLGAVSEISETVDEGANEARFTLAGDPAGIALALADNPRGILVRSYLGFLDGSNALIDAPTVEFSGFGSHFLVDPGAEVSTVTLVCYDETGDQERPLEERYTDQDQKRMHPGDRGLEYVADLPNKQFTWGNASVRTAQPGGSPPADDSNPDQYPE